MADIIDPSYVNVQMIKADNNNNTTSANDDSKIIEVISPSEQCDILENNQISENVSQMIILKKKTKLLNILVG